MPFQDWPFSNIHNVNLDWILTQLQEVFRRLTGLQDQIDRILNGGESQTTPFAVNIYEENEMWHCSATPAQLVANAKNCYITINDDDGSRYYPDFVDTNIAGTYVLLSCDIMEDVGTQDWVQTIINISWRYGDNDITVSLNEITAYNGNPSAPGTASPGFSNNYARGDHRHPKELPDVSATDNGKSLVVENGAWEKSNALQTKSITDTGNYYTTDTVEGALQEIGAELTDPVLEEIVTVTGDGTRPMISVDKNGKPFSLKKVVVKMTLGADASASGSIGVLCRPSASVIKNLASLYFTWSASAKAAWTGMGIVEQDAGYWKQHNWGFAANGYSLMYGSEPFCYTDAVSDYPTVGAIYFGQAIPSGMEIKVYGVKA